MKRLLFLLMSFVAVAVWATTPSVDISSAGPLIHVWIGNDLSAQVEHTDDAPVYEIYSPSVVPADFGTFIAMGGTLYAPDFDNHDISGTDSLVPYTPFTAVSQTAVTGSGTSMDPYQVITVGSAALTGLVITQTDTYIVGDNFFTTSVSLHNTSISTMNGILYRAFDAVLGGDDTGYGFTETLSGSRNAVGCSVNANNTPPGKIIELIPTTGGNNYYQNLFDNVWLAVAAQTAFPDTCQCSTLLDNGAGISWTFSIAAAGTAVYAHTTVFQPVAPSPTPTATVASEFSAVFIR